MPSQYRQQIKDYMKGYRQYVKNPTAPVPEGGTDYSQIKSKEQARYSAFESAKKGLSTMPDSFESKMGKAKNKFDMASGAVPYHTKRQKKKYDRRVKKDYNKDMLPKPVTKPPEPGPGPSPVPSPSPSPAPIQTNTSTSLRKNKRPVTTNS